MVLTLPREVYLRQYGRYSYVFSQIDWSELLMRDAGIKIVAGHKNAPNGSFAITNRTRVPNVLDKRVICDDDVVIKHLLSIGSEVAGIREAVSDGSQDVEPTDDTVDVCDSLMGYFQEHPTPFELCIDLTRACTERCVHCYVPGFQNVYLPYEMVEKVLSEFAAMGGLKVKLTGGECMLHPDFERIVALARANDMVISVLSNLTCCDLEKTQAMKDAGVAVVQVSLYGMTPETHEAVTRVKGSLAKTLRGIEILQKAGVPVQIHCPVLKQNVSGIDAVARYGRERGVKTTFDAVMMSRADHGCNESCGLSDAELRQFIGAHEDLPDKLTVCPDADADEAVCEIGTSKICLSAEGKYYPCNGCYGLILGDCRNQSLAEVWNDEPIKRLRALKMRDLSACRVCPNRMLCAPCPSRNFNANGDLTLPDAAMCKAAACRRSIVERRAKEN